MDKLSWKLIHESIAEKILGRLRFKFCKYICKIGLSVLLAYSNISCRHCFPGMMISNRVMLFLDGRFWKDRILGNCFIVGLYSKD
jgi:hypothetical protein